jgi:hypothetical protein
MKGIVGNWVAKDGAAAFSAPAAGEIVGHLFLYSAAGPRIQELWILRPQAGSVLVRQKHYTPDLKGREDPARLTAALMRGVGKAKAYGCGLLLVRPSRVD